MSDHVTDPTAENHAGERRRFLRLALMATAMGVAWPDALLAATNVLAPVRKPRPPRLLVIDPGHGGHDPGAIGLTGTEEKGVTLDIARRIAETLSARPGITVQLTRE